MPFRRLRFTVLFLASLVIGLWHQPGFRSTLAGVLAYFLAFGIWLAVVAPVNRTVAARAPERRPETRPGRQIDRHSYRRGPTAGSAEEATPLSCNT